MIITARKRSLRRLCFYRCLSVHGGGCLPQCMLGCHPPEADPPGADTPPEQTLPRGRHPPGSRHPPEADTPQEADTPPRSRHPWSRHTPLEADPPGADMPPPQKQTPSSPLGADTPTPQKQTPPLEADTPPQSMLGDTVNARAVRILLECNLVCVYFSRKLIIYNCKTSVVDWARNLLLEDYFPSVLTKVHFWWIC